MAYYTRGALRSSSTFSCAPAIRRFQTQTFLSQLKESEKVDAPSKIAQESSLPTIEQDLKINPRQPKKKSVRMFNIDMDRSRAGPVAGSVYFGECKRQGMVYPNEELSVTAKYYYETLGLPRSFSQWFQITALHYWILSVRMRAMPFKYGRNYQQKLVDRIFSDLELRMAEELGISSNRIIEGYLKDYHTQLLGAVVSYDEGLMTDDITLAAALWRNIFNGNPNADMRHLESLVEYVRAQLYVLNKMTDREFGFGKFRFVPPDEVVKPLTKAQEEQLRERAKEEFSNLKLPSQRSVLSLDE